MAGHIKSKLESPELTRNQSDQVQLRLSACLASDPQHITPRQTGDHVRAIQDALTILGQRLPDLGLPSITDASGFYGDDLSLPGCTANVVLKYKTKRDISRPGQQIDNIVGRMTITQLDDDLLRSTPAPVPPKPIPQPDPPPSLVAGAGVQIGSVLGRHRGKTVDGAPLALEYYQNCGRETIHVGRQVVTSNIRRFNTLEDLIDLLLRRSELHQVIVNHGDPNEGLIMRYCKEASRRDTGRGIGNLSELADRMDEGSFNLLNPDDQTKLKFAAKDMGLRPPSQPVVLRLVSKIVQLRRKRFIMHFRACQISDDVGLVSLYKSAFGAGFISFHSTRILFVPIKPKEFLPGHSSAEFKPDENTEIFRVRIFQDSLGLLPNLVIEIDDIDRHTDVTVHTGVDRPLVAGQIKEWAETLVGEWRGPATEFVVPVMWKSENELTFHLPLEVGWASKLEFVF